MRILVVEDDDTLAEALVEALEDEAYAVDRARDGRTASQLVDVNPYDLVVLDWTIPPPTGIELLRTWRRAGLAMPVLMLTGRGGVTDRVDGLDSGADDYLGKPFALPELLARVRSMLRRREKPMPALRAGDVELDRGARRVTVGGREVKLTPKELGVLEYLLTRQDEVVSRAEISEHAWDDAFDAMSNTIDVTVYRLRKKIDGSRRERLLHTVKGVGYVLRRQRETET